MKKPTAVLILLVVSATSASAHTGRARAPRGDSMGPLVVTATRCPLRSPIDPPPRVEPVLDPSPAPELPSVTVPMPKLVLAMQRT